MNAEEQATQADSPPASAAYYRKILSRGGPAGSTLEAREGVDGEADLSDPAIRERLDYARLGWDEVIRTHFGNKPRLLRLARKLVNEADTALRIVRDDDDALLSRIPAQVAHLESIVRLDGSRPSFMIRNGEVDLTTSPAGSWADQLIPPSAALRQTLRCVGRIDYPKASQKFVGTGFLLADNLLLTNRHVLDEIADRNASGKWTFRKDVTVNFGHEFQTTTNAQVRVPKAVLFCGPDLSAAVNHADTDVALIELKPASAPAGPIATLGFDASTDWVQEGAFIYTIGYPANPGMPATGSGVTFTLLDELFKSTYGFKRLAPGELMATAPGFTNRTMTHDATTLGGNSGSVIVSAGRVTMAAGLHYAGRSAAPRANWGHVLMNILNATDGKSAKTFGDWLTEQGVDLTEQ